MTTKPRKDPFEEHQVVQVFCF